MVVRYQDEGIWKEAKKEMRCAICKKKLDKRDRVWAVIDGVTSVICKDDAYKRRGGDLTISERVDLDPRKDVRK